MPEQPSETIHRFFSSHRRVEFSKGESVLQPLAQPDGLFYLQEGIVNMIATSPKGEEVVINVFKSGSFFPVQAVVHEESWKNEFSFVAVEDLVVYKAPLAEAKAFLQQHPEVVWNLLQRIYRGLDGMFLRLAQLMAGSARSRVIQEVITRARRFGVRDESGIWVVPVAENELAALTGVTRETVSRVLSELKHKGLASYALQEISIPDLERLEEEV